MSSNFPSKKLVGSKATRRIPSTGTDIRQPNDQARRQPVAPGRGGSKDDALVARSDVPAQALTVAQGFISANGDTKKKLSYADLLGGMSFNREVTGKIKPKSPSDYKLVGKSVPRVDIPPKVSGEPAYLQNLRMTGMSITRSMPRPS
jgi:nicotinate dehydrogenase subunit B